MPVSKIVQDSIDSSQALSTVGITFPATQSASTDANTLDDYEEGTFTPVLKGASADPTGVTYNGQEGKYVKIGRMVYCQIYLFISNIGTGGSGQLGINLPFTSGTFTDYQPNFPNLEELVTARSGVVSLVLPSSALLRFWYNNGATTGMTDINFASDVRNGLRIRLNITYST